MFYKIFFQELKKNLLSPAFYIFLAIFFAGALIFTLTTDPYTQFMGIGHSKEWHNAPIIIAQIMTRFGVLGLLFTMVIVGRAVAKDFEVNIHELVFSKPMKKMDYLGGRFFGSLTANILLFTGIILGFEVGISILSPEYSGPYRLGSYLLPLLLLIIPNLLFMGSILFALATLTRKMISTYLAGIAFLAVYGIVNLTLLYRLDSEMLKILLDPFGITSLTLNSSFWTVADMNSLLIPVDMPFLMNRAIWLSISIVVIYVTYRKFEFVSFLEKRKKRLAVISDKTDLLDYDIPTPQIILASSKLFTFSQCLTNSFRDFRRIIFHPAFLILSVIALTEISANFRGGLGNQTGHIYPFTSWFLEQTLHVWIYMLPMTIFFGGMLVWKEKDHKTDEIINSLPIPNWFNYAQKLLTLTGIYILYLGLTLITGVITQVFILDFHNIELGLYFKQLFGIDFLIFLHMAIVVLFIQNLSPNKYIGFFLSALFFAADLIIFGAFGYDNYLLRYGRVPEFIYSNMNGFGHYAQIILWYSIYWLLFGAVIVWLTILLWRRTSENSLRLRFKYLRKNISRPQIGGLSILLIMFIICGTFIGYNKYGLNSYMSDKMERKMSADYERKFSIYKNTPLPTITDIGLTVDLYPGERIANIVGTYVLTNPHEQAINQVHVNLNDWNLSNLHNIVFDRDFDKAVHSTAYGFRIFDLHKPLAPGDTLRMNFEYDIIATGFSDNHPKNDLVENGTCLILSSFVSDYFPIIGYNVNNELIRDKYRLEYDLPAKDDAPSVVDADPTLAIVPISRPNYEAVISTSAEQTVISGGHLIKSWKEGDRNYFHYKTDTIIENELAIISGRYAMQQQQYEDVNIEVYYHPEHDYNIQSIMEGLSDSYDYGNKYFSEYPYRDLRIVEIPAYMTYGAARHFPTTFIWTETEGFITRFEEEDINIVYGIAAHENAHHWWAGIVTPAYAEGAFMLTETLCQYVMGSLTEEKYGTEIGRDYYRREMESYLRRRKKDVEGERPLAYSSVRQSYLGYKKSSVVMNAMQKYIGEDSVGVALGRIVEKFGYRLDTFALSTDLINEFYNVTPDSLTYLIDDLFKRITLFENKIISAKYSKDDNKGYLVDLEYSLSKFYADSIGNQEATPLKDYIFIELLDDNDNPIYHKVHYFDEPSGTIQLLVNSQPASAVIDPDHLLIDRDLQDNSISF